MIQFTFVEKNAILKLISQETTISSNTISLRYCIHKSIQQAIKGDYIKDTLSKQPPIPEIRHKLMIISMYLHLAFTFCSLQIGYTIFFILIKTLSNIQRKKACRLVREKDSQQHAKAFSFSGNENKNGTKIRKLQIRVHKNIKIWRNNWEKIQHTFVLLAINIK